MFIIIEGVLVDEILILGVVVNELLLTDDDFFYRFRKYKWEDCSTWMKKCFWSKQNSCKIEY